jgi:RHS repeat-associated protein
MTMRTIILIALLAAVPLRAEDAWQYAYDGAGNITRIGPENYRYDHAGRLTSSNQQQFAYDLHGNLTRITTGTQTAGFAVETSSNQLDGTCPPGTDLCYRAIYDAAGNVIGRAAAGEFQWDALGVLKERHSDRDERFLYDANDERIATIQPTFTRYTLRAADHKVVRELTDAGGTWSLTRDYVHRGGTLVASFSGTSTTPARHYHVDHLASTRLVTDANGFRVSATTYLPFGREAEGSEASAERMKFTGHERDATGNSPGLDLDYMHARYYDPTAGRFLSVDPKGTYTAPPTPQRWNRYAYASNNPVARFDPDGKRDVYVAIWNSRITKGSVGHAAAFEMNGSVILSQFPKRFSPYAANRTLSYPQTVAEEKRSPDFIYKVSVPDDAKFDKAAKENREASNWVLLPLVKGGTNCSKAVGDSLGAGGVPMNVPGVPDSTGVQTLPDGLNAWLTTLMVVHDDNDLWDIETVDSKTLDRLYTNPQPQGSPP